MPTKAKTAPRKTTKPTIKPENGAIQTIIHDSCPSLSDSCVLEYEIGVNATVDSFFRIKETNANGFFSSEWVNWQDVLNACKAATSLTSYSLRPVFKGKSVNTAGFLLAALLKQGLVARKPGKSRCYQLTGKAEKFTVNKTG